MIIINDVSGKRDYIEKTVYSVHGIGQSEVKTIETGSSKVRTILIPGGHIYVGKVLPIYTKYANWKKEKV